MTFFLAKDVIFPNLGIEIENLNRVAFSIFDAEIYFYAMCIAIAFFLGLQIACFIAKKTGQNEDNYLDYLVIAFIPIIIGVRLYFVIFDDALRSELLTVFKVNNTIQFLLNIIVVATFSYYLYRKKDKKYKKMLNYILLSIAIFLSLNFIENLLFFSTWQNFFTLINIRNGGLAIYGGIIAAGISLLFFTKKKGLSFLLMADTAILGLTIGQAIGRLGNFFNMEAFGGYYTGKLSMMLKLEKVYGTVSKELIENKILLNGYEYISVHPTFLYEILWNLALTVILIFLTKNKKFDGQVFIFYLIGYGVGRFWIEGLRTDQLILFGTGLAVSQILSIFLVIFGIMLYLILNKRRKV